MHVELSFVTNMEYFCVLCCCLYVLFSSTNIAYENEMQLLGTFVGENGLFLVFVGGRYGE